jgi:hypothetical protein
MRIHANDMSMHFVLVPNTHLPAVLMARCSNPGIDAAPAFLNRVIFHLLAVKAGLVLDARQTIS